MTHAIVQGTDCHVHSGTSAHSHTLEFKTHDQYCIQGGTTIRMPDSFGVLFLIWKQRAQPHYVLTQCNNTHSVLQCLTLCMASNTVWLVHMLSVEHNIM